MTVNSGLMVDNRLELKSIGDLLGEIFYIASYQRGYRWTEEQVKYLLDDVWDFINNRPSIEKGEEEPFYCLQPIVVKQNDKYGWEVIDGQQRLTTIYLILITLELFIDGDEKNLGKIIYETRPTCVDYLNNIIESDRYKSVDHNHIYRAFTEIKSWFNKKANEGNRNARGKFSITFLENVKVIWYEINEDSKVIDIFTRLNVGKIPLTNAELVKALFLKSSNFNCASRDETRLKQLQIATEWDYIESTLQDDSFWYFISDNAKTYSTRIEFIFDLMKEKKQGDDKYHTFHEFYDEFKQVLTKEGNPDIDTIWLRVKTYFLTFEDWYRSRELYHLVGFLVASGGSLQQLKKQSSKTKTAFREFLELEIQSKVSKNIEDLTYDNNKLEIKNILLLFNIQTILANKASNIRFPFDRFKKESWDIEHIRSQTDRKINGNARINWIKDVLEYFTGEKELLRQEKEVEIIESSIKESLKDLIEVIKAEKIDDSLFDGAYDCIIKEFKEDVEPEDIHSISNLALLDATTNRSYKNAVFPIKRKTILENDMNGTFIPICTKNVFLKAYSKKLDDIMIWHQKDAKCYLSAIKETLNKYLAPLNESNNG